jgi:hypothetical protein
MNRSISFAGLTAGAHPARVFFLTPFLLPQLPQKIPRDVFCGARRVAHRHPAVDVHGRRRQTSRRGEKGGVNARALACIPRVLFKMLKPAATKK